MHRLWKSVTVASGLALTVPVFAWVNMTIKQGDTLSAVAAKYRPANVAAMDMIIAIRNANPAIVQRGFQAGMQLKVPTTTTEVREAITGSGQKPTTSTKPQATVKKSAPPVKTKPVEKPPASASIATASANNAQIANYQATISSLQQELNNQAQTLQNYQEQIANLTQQLNTQAQSGSMAKSKSYLSFSGLWFILWLITFILFLRARKKNHLLFEAKVRPQPEIEPTLATEREEQEPIVPSISPALPKKPSPQQHNPVEPRLYESSEESWHQVELDIPASDTSALPHHRPSFNPEEQQELSGEQQNIIREIANDHDNIDWHMALLEFYIKTDNQGGFTRHMQTMTRTGLMAEGDSLWEKIRKMYLNGWIYKEEK